MLVWRIHCIVCMRHVAQTTGVPGRKATPWVAYINHNVCATTTDENTPANSTSYQYNDLLGRLTEIDYPDGGKTTYGYANACAQPSTTTKLITGSTAYSETSTMDGFCHTTKAAIADPENTSSTLQTDTNYDGWGRVWQVSNPYHGSAGDWTTYTYDPLGRTTQVLNPDLSSTTTNYGSNCSAQLGYCSTVTDAGGRVRRLWTDSLGRLTAVSEDPNNWNFQTTYTYNGLDDLLAVSQSGQSRSFTYDSLSRLTQSQNPEINVNGTPCSITYGYDANGNLSSKTAPQPNQYSSCSSTVTTSYGYDALNRVLYKEYYPDTTTVRAAYAYDGIYGWGDTMVNPVGHLTSSWSVQHDGTVVAANETNYFDAMGRPQRGGSALPPRAA